jgi:bifunctional non-homologous end joining protein LigD
LCPERFTHTNLRTIDEVEAKIASKPELTMLRLRTGGPAGFIIPCQPMTAHKPPAGPGWIHEIKHDGYRMMARREGERVQLLTRNGDDWSERLPAVMTALNMLKVRSCVIDGEAVVCDELGLAVFKLMRSGGRVKHDAHLIAFDLLELDGRDLRREPIEVRKAELARILEFSTGKPRHALGAAPLHHPGLQLCEHIEQPGDVVFGHACKLGCEGIVSKRVGSKYRRGPGKCSDWIKVKNPAAPAVKREAEEEWGKRR